MASPAIISLSEVPSDTAARALSLVLSLALLFLLSRVLSRGALAGFGQLLCEYYLAISVALLISSVTWEFYSVWLLPAFLAVLLAPERVLPAVRWRWAVSALLAVAFIGLNLPGDCASSVDCYLFGPNGHFYHPGWVPGVWLERQIGVYADHLGYVMHLRLASLAVVALVLAGLVLAWRPMGAAAVGGEQPGGSG
jgi:hypothetical protein